MCWIIVGTCGHQGNLGNLVGRIWFQPLYKSRILSRIKKQSRHSRNQGHQWIIVKEGPGCLSSSGFSRHSVEGEIGISNPAVLDMAIVPKMPVQANNKSFQQRSAESPPCLAIVLFDLSEKEETKNGQGFEKDPSRYNETKPLRSFRRGRSQLCVGEYTHTDTDTSTPRKFMPCS
ncbi:hypothetical protein BD289DRAFT_8774 [Coniella lustricola]|uniref:Uncharacterized protein n=1 Tax=Coniella lustricola TaxID=2025994 RepID=A0A2T3AJT1_9PEZI|nr:hypothetical protein BD289DRAFT_8774 [Coniella lustricola]